MDRVDFDSPEYRKKLWDKEYSSRKGLPSTNTYNPSLSLKLFLDENRDINKDLAVDIGCGNGRNCLYLFERGFNKVLGYDISTEAINLGKKVVEERNLYSNISLVDRDIADGIDATDETVDLIIDMMTMHSLVKASREATIKESIRTLKVGGHYLLFTIDADSPSSQSLTQSNPGPEPNSYRFNIDTDTITEKAFTKDELISIFSPLQILSYKKIETDTKAYNNLYRRVYCNVVFQKI